MARPPLSVTIITLNEEKNITRAIESVRWAEDILVVDSGSQDRTVEKAKALGARVMTRAWEGYGQQKNYAQQNSLHDWVLNIDADEEVSPELHGELLVELEAIGAGKSSAKGFRIPRKTFYLGKWILHGGWYPNYLSRLANRKSAQWNTPEVHEDLIIQGEIKTLKKPLHHFSFGSIQDQIRTNLKYSWLGFQKLRERGEKPSLFMLLWKPLGKFFETYVIKRGFLDGLPGFIISINAAHSMFLKYSYLFEAEINHESSNRR